jgi:hypothetical protein
MTEPNHKESEQSTTATVMMAEMNRELVTNHHHLMYNPAGDQRREGNRSDLCQVDGLLK